MDLTFIQTADPIFYYPMLHQTSRTVRQYCIRNGLRYESYVGIKRGHMPWQAAYNRVYMLKEMIDRGVTGWVFYMDADALIGDMNFDVRRYLDDKRHYAGIFSGFCSSDKGYDINSGGFAINLSHVTGRSLALDYWKVVQDIPEAEYNRAIRWGRDIPEDQIMLFGLLRDYVENKNHNDTFLFERANEGYTNHGPFIRQRLRAKSPDFRTRAEEIRREVDGIMAGQRDNRGDTGPGYYLRADHPRLVTSVSIRRDGVIHSTGQAGMMLYGPHIPLPAGGYVARVFGEAYVEHGGEAKPLRVEIVSEFGETNWGEGSAEIAGPVKGLLLEQAFGLVRDVEHLEVRVWLDDPRLQIGIHAIQIEWTDPWITE